MCAWIVQAARRSLRRWNRATRTLAAFIDVATEYCEMHEQFLHDAVEAMPPPDRLVLLLRR